MPKPALPAVKIGIPIAPNKSHIAIAIVPHRHPKTPPANAQTKVCNVIGTGPIGKAN